MHYALENELVQKNGLTDYRSQIESIASFLTHSHLTEDSAVSPQVITTIRQLEFLARDDERSFVACNEPWFFNVAKVLRDLYGYWETLLEFREARQLLQKKIDAFLTESDQINRTFYFAEEEGRAVGATKNSRVAFIGSGPFPESAIAIALSF